MVRRMSRVVWGMTFVWAVFWAWVGWGLQEIRSVRQPEYTVIERHDGYEIREYPSLLVAQVSISGLWTAAHTEASRMLTDYISGNNSIQEAFAMSRPAGVEPGPDHERIAQHVPVLTQEKNGEFVISYVMPSTYTIVTLPRPNNPEIRIIQIPSRTVAVRTFTGWVNPVRAQRQADLLQKLLTDDNRGMVRAHTIAQFSPPWTVPFIRHNAVFIPVNAQE